MGRFALAVCIAISLWGCGSAGNPAPVDSGNPVPKVGDTCGTSGAQWPTGAYCESDAGPLGADALDCQTGKLVVVPCRGVLDCTRTGTSVVCPNDFPQEGDRCFTGNAEQAICSSDAGTFFQCKGDAGFFWRGQHCPGRCAVSGSAVTCNP